MQPENYLVVSNKDPLIVNDFNEIIAAIEGSFFNMRYLAIETDFDDDTQRKRYRDNIVYLKRLYERGERIALND
jgi:hypothetical protein